MTSLVFVNCTSEICPNINIIHCPTEINENAKPTLNNSWMINGKTILQLPGTRKVFHFFIRFTDCVVPVQTITSDSSDSKEFSFLTRNLLQVKFYQLLIFSTFMILITAKESGWKFYMKMNPTLALLLVWIYLINLLVVSVWFLLRVSTGSLSLKGIQFGIVSLISLGNQIMIQQWTDKVVCTNYKHLIRAYH